MIVLDGIPRFIVRGSALPKAKVLAAKKLGMESLPSDYGIAVFDKYKPITEDGLCIYNTRTLELVI